MFQGLPFKQGGPFYLLSDGRKKYFFAEYKVAWDFKPLKGHICR
jgi:hypothetical protein